MLIKMMFLIFWHKKLLKRNSYTSTTMSAKTLLIKSKEQHHIHKPGQKGKYRYWIA